jgi:hypothetical protein
MSECSWEKEFYPIEAGTIATRYSRGEATLVDLVEHSLNKWIGLRRHNLEKHDVLEINPWGYIDPPILVTASTCSLCQAFYQPFNEYDDDPCQKCPLYQARGNIPCDAERDDEELAPYYEFFQGDETPEPMISWLRKTLDFVTEQQRNKEPR